MVLTRRKANQCRTCAREPRGRTLPSDWLALGYRAHHLARPAHPLLVRLLGRRPSFVHSPPWIPSTHPPLPFPPDAGGVTGVDEGTEYTFFQWVRVVRLGPGPDPRSPRRPAVIHCRRVLGRVLQLLGILLVNGWLANTGGRSSASRVYVHDIQRLFMGQPPPSNLGENRGILSDF